MEVFVGSKHLNVSVSTAHDVTGREHLVVVAKATWSIPSPGQRPRPLPAQPLSHTDHFTGAPGMSALRYGCDIYRFKPRCDLLFDACAQAPEGKPVRHLGVGFRVGPLTKALNVHGRRYWRKTLGGFVLSTPELFTRMPLHYDLAFGGSHAYRLRNGEELHETFLDNPVGVGWAGRHSLDQLANAPAPSLEALDDPIRRPDAKHRPMALGALGRQWPTRLRYAGTCDEHWQQNVFPFMPEDFDERFHQVAPEDQQMDFPQGGEDVVLLNLVPGRPDVRFHLPALKHMPVRILRKDYSTHTANAVVDTLFFETEQQRFSAVWRTSTPILRRIQEFGSIAIGPVDPQWWRGKTLGIEGCSTCGQSAGGAGA